MKAGIASGLLLAALGACSGQAAEVPASNAAAPAADAAGAPCELSGESVDTDPDGLRVHAGPDLASPELGRLYPAVDPEAYFHGDDGNPGDALVGARFTIDRAAGDWLHIADIDPIADGMPLGDRPRPNYQGSGWVQASKVRLIFTSAAARARPDADAPLVANARFSNGYEASFLRSCRGRWARMEQAPEESGRPGARVEAWLLSESNRRHADVLRESLAQESDSR